MISNLRLSFWISLIFSILLSAPSIRAQSNSTLDIPDDELARESVYPVFENPVSVKNRNVTTAKRFDIGVFGGLALTEPVFNTVKLGLAGNYHLNEDHSIGGILTMNNAGLSRDAEEIKNTFQLDYNRAPKPKMSIFADYNYKPFYGKISLSKQLVLNTTIYGSAGFGVIQFDHKSFPGISLGVGERFYFNRSLSFKIDFRLLMHNAPIPFKGGVLLPSNPVPDYSVFDERLTITSNLEFGLNFLF